MVETGRFSLSCNDIWWGRMVFLLMLNLVGKMVVSLLNTAISHFSEGWFNEILRLTNVSKILLVSCLFPM